MHSCLMSVFDRLKKLLFIGFYFILFYFFIILTERFIGFLSPWDAMFVFVILEPLIYVWSSSHAKYLE